MKVAILGAEGQVGTFLTRRLLGNRHVVSGTSLLGQPGLPALDIRDEAAVLRHLRSETPDYVILTAALTHVEKCETEPELARAINVTGPRNVAQACHTLGAGLAFFSSDYVFDGASGPNREEDEPSPASVYGQNKRDAEAIVSNLVKHHLIARTAVVYSYLPGSVNFFMQILDRARKKEPITVPADQIGNPTQAVNLAGALVELIEAGERGIYNLVGTTRAGREELARRFLHHLGLGEYPVKAVPTAELRQKAARPLWGGLTTDKAQAVLRHSRLWDLETSIRFTVAQMKGESDEVNR